MTSCWKFGTHIFNLAVLLLHLQRHGLNVQFIESYVGVVIQKFLNIQRIYVGFDFVIWVVIAAYTASGFYYFIQLLVCLSLLVAATNVCVVLFHWTYCVC